MYDVTGKVRNHKNTRDVDVYLLIAVKGILMLLYLHVQPGK